MMKLSNTKLTADVGRDVKCQMQAEEANRESESRCRAFVEDAADWIWEMNLDRVCTYSNQRLESILGYTTKEFMTFPLEDLIHPVDLKDVQNRILTHIAEGTGWERWVLRFRHKDGDYRYLESTATPVFDRDGTMCGFRGIDRDVTGQFFADSEIRSSENMIHTLFESVSDAILLIDYDHETVTDCNPVALMFFETTRDELIGKIPWTISPNMQPDGVSSKKKGRAFFKDARAGKPVRFEWVHTTKDGATVYADISLNRVILRGVTRFLAILRDITESKETHKALAHQAEFQHRLAEISAKLTSMQPEMVDEAITKSLEDVCKIYDLASASIWWFTEDQDSFNCSHRWNREGVNLPPARDTIKIADAPWSTRVVASGEKLILNDLDDLPADAAADKAYLRMLNYASYLALPLLVEGTLLGTCTFGATRQRTWDKNLVEELQLLGTALAIAISRARAATEISRHAEFQARLAQLSTALLTTTPEKTNAGIEQALQTIGLDYRLDSMGMWWIAQEEDVLLRRSGWQRETVGDVQFVAGLTRANVPWIADFVFKGKILKVDDVGDMPAEAHLDQSVFQRLGFSSLAVVPMRIDDVVVGCCGFVTIEQRHWDDETVQEFQILADFLANACARLNAAAELSLREQDLARSQRVAQVGSFKLVANTSNRANVEVLKIIISDQASRIFGIEATDNSSDQTMSLIHPDDRDRVIQSWKKTLLTRSQHNLEFRVVRPDGTLVYVETIGQVDHVDDKDWVTAFGTIQDVTDWVEANQQLEHALLEIGELRDRLQDENLFLKEEVRAAHGFDKIIGQDSGLKRVLVAAEKVAPTDVTVLITGETGTGKELIAQAIHDLSHRKDKAIVTVNCAALSADLIESELFGHEKGAFTGAHAMRKGRFELADGGTLFLDEIGELSGDLQAKLLRVLQEGRFERLGGTRTLQVDVRFIAATNRKLKYAVNSGEFRADLYYRISSFPIEMPPLRERPDDIPILAEHFVRKHAPRLGKVVQSISAQTIRCLKNRTWPGNVRELEGFIQRALISNTGSILDYLDEGEHEVIALSSTPVVAASNLRATERHHIIKILKQSKWRIEGKHGAASALGIPPSSLRSKMKRLDIERPS